MASPNLAGTVLVRPDGVIAWRTPQPAAAAGLDHALHTAAPAALSAVEALDQLRAAGLLLHLVRLHYPAEFLAALLGAQPMEFYSPQSLPAGARRHGVTRTPQT
jgi:hypothetical protein